MNSKINVTQPWLTVTKYVTSQQVSLHIGSAETGPLVEIIFDKLSDRDTISCHCQDFEQLHLPNFGSVEVDFLNNNGADCR